MSKTLTTSDRVMLLMNLVPYLLEHGPRSVQELSEAFDVQPKTLRRLVRFLGIAGVPGETRTYQHEDLFDIDWDALETHDIVSLTNVVAVDDTPRFSSAETAALIAGLHALAPMLPQEMRETARSTAEKLGSVQAVDARRATVSVTADADDERLAQISAAINSREHVAFEYRDASGNTTERTVRPLLLGQTGEAWYLRAYCLNREAERTFLVDRMRSPRRLQATDITAAVATLAVESMTFASLLAIDDAPIVATVSMRLTAVHRLADFAPRVTGELRPGWVSAEIDLMHPAVAVRLVQAAPGDVVVHEPAAAREAAREWAARALAHYDV